MLLKSYKYSINYLWVDYPNEVLPRLVTVFQRHEQLIVYLEFLQNKVIWYFGAEASYRLRQLCSHRREIPFVSQIGSDRASVRTIICKWSDRMCVSAHHQCIYIGCRGNDVGVKEPRDDTAMPRGGMEIHHITLQTVALSSPRAGLLCCIRHVSDGGHGTLWCAARDILPPAQDWPVGTLMANSGSSVSEWAGKRDDLCGPLI